MSRLFAPSFLEPKPAGFSYLLNTANRVLCLLAVFALTLRPANSTTFTWTATAGGPLTDGSGTWNFSSSPNWFNNSTGTYGGWGFATDTAVFGAGNGSGTAYIDLAASGAGAIVFNPAGTGSYDLISTSFNHLNMSGSDPTITVNADARIDARIDVDNTGLTILGSGSLYLENVFGGKYFNQAGTGITTLASPGDGYFNCPVAISAGTLKTGSGLGIIDNDVSISSPGTLSLAGNSLGVSSIAGSGTIENGGPDAATLTVRYSSSWSDTRSSTFSGTIQDGATGPLSLTHAGLGTLTLSGANSYTGQTMIGVYAPSDRVILEVTSLADGGSPSGIGASSNAASNLWFSGGNLRYVGSAVSTDRLFTLGSNASGDAGGIDSSGTGAIHFTNPGSVVVSPQLSESSILILTGSNTENNILSPAIGSNAGIRKEGTGTWVLAGNNTYTNSTQVDSGILVAGSSSAFGTSSATTVASGATLRLNGYNTGLGSLAGGGTVENMGSASATLTVEGSNTPTQTVENTFSGAIRDGAGAGALALVKAGTGFQALSGTNNYTGPTTVNAGVLQFATTSSLYGGASENWTASNLVVQANATAAFNVGGAGEFTSLDIAALTQLGTTTGGFLSGSSIGLDASHAPGAAFVHAADMTNPNGGTASIGVSVLGAGAVTLSGNNTYTGATKLDGGALIAGSTSAFGNHSATVINSGTLSLNGFDISIGSLAGSGTVDNGSAIEVTLTVGGNNDGTTFNGIIWDGGAGALALTKTGTGTLSLAGLNLYSGPTTVTAGTLNVTGFISSSVTVLPGAKLVVNSYAAGTVTLNGSGPGGRAVLGGNGTIATALMLTDLGSTLSPGNSPGTLSFTTDQTWNSFTYDWEINDFAGSTPGTHFDVITIDGTLTLAGAVGSYVLNVLSLDLGNVPGAVENFSETSHSWDILATTNGISGFDAADWILDTSAFVSAPTSQGNFSIGVAGNNLELYYTPVPEPSGAILVGTFVALGLLGRSRRKGA